MPRTLRGGPTVLGKRLHVQDSDLLAVTARLALMTSLFLRTSYIDPSSSSPLDPSLVLLSSLYDSPTLDAWYEIPHFAPTVVGIRTAMHACRCCHTSHFSSILITDFLPALFTCTLFLQPLSRVDLDQQPFGTNIPCYPCPPAAAVPIGFFTGSARSTLYSWASRNRTLGLLRHSP